MEEKLEKINISLTGTCLFWALSGYFLTQNVLVFWILCAISMSLYFALMNFIKESINDKNNDNFDDFE